MDEVFLANNSNSQNLFTNLLKSSQTTNQILQDFVQSLDKTLKAKNIVGITSGDEITLHNSAAGGGMEECTVASTSKQEPTEQRKIWVKYGFLTLYEINSVEQTFNAEILIQLKWTDDALEEVAQADTECYLQQCWTPDVKIFNLVKENVSQQQMFVSEEPAMNYQPIVVIRRKIQGVFKMKMQLTDFPFDYQDLPIILYSEHPRDKVELKEDLHEFSYFNKDHFNHPQEWTIFDHVDIIEGNPNNILPTDFGQSTNVKVSSGKSKHVEMNESSYSSKGGSGGGVNEKKRFVSTMSSFLTARCRVKRKPNFYLYNICLTVLLLISISFALFLMPGHSSIQSKGETAATARVIGSLLLLLIMFNFRSMVSSWVPLVSYFTFVDKYLYTQTIYLSLVVALQALLTFVYQQNWSWNTIGEAEINFCEMIVAGVLLFTQITAHIILFIRFKIRSRKSAAFIALCEKVYEHKISVILSNATKRRHSTQTEKARKGYARYMVAAKATDIETGSPRISLTMEKRSGSGDSDNLVAALRPKENHGAGGSFTEGHGTKSVRFPSQS